MPENEMAPIHQTSLHKLVIVAGKNSQPLQLVQNTGSVGNGDPFQTCCSAQTRENPTQTGQIILMKEESNGLVTIKEENKSDKISWMVLPDGSLVKNRRQTHV